MNILRGVMGLGITFVLVGASVAGAQISCLDASDGDPLCAVQVDSEGLVGIGTTAPAADLEVDGSVLFSGGDGDVNLSGSLSISDLTLITGYLDGVQSLTPVQMAAADFDGDGRVTLDDYGMIYQVAFYGKSREEAHRLIHAGYGMETVGKFVVKGQAVVTSHLSASAETIGAPGAEGFLDVHGPILQRSQTLFPDYVFDPEFQLESIEEHAETMWRERSLGAIPSAQVDANGYSVVEVGSLQRGVVEELEKAHIYIAELHERLALQEAALAQALERLERLENASPRP
jgi:hypothetical protein